MDLNNPQNCPSGWNQLNASSVRALKIYEKRRQAIAIDFADHIIAKIPFRIG
jgi:hypothetical protein